MNEKMKLNPDNYEPILEITTEKKENKALFKSER